MMSQLYLGPAPKTDWSEIKVQVLISSGIKEKFESFSNIMELSVDFGQKQISLSDVMVLGYIFGYPQNVNNRSAFNTRRG